MAAATTTLTFGEVYTWDFVGVPEAVKRQNARPWTSSEVLYNVLLMVVAFMVLVTAIYWPWIHDDQCTSWCCRSSDRASTNAVDARGRSSEHRLPFEPRESKVSLSQFSRDKNAAESGSSSAVMVLDNLFTGLATLMVPHKPLYTISKLAAEQSQQPRAALR